MPSEIEGELRGLRFDTAWEDEFTHIPIIARALSHQLSDLGVDHIFEEYNCDHRQSHVGANGAVLHRSSAILLALVGIPVVRAASIFRHDTYGEENCK